MMKSTYFSWGLAALGCAVLMTACQKDKPSSDSMEDKEAKQYAVNVRIHMPSTVATKAEAPEPGFADGEAAEYTVNNVYFQFFDDDDNRMGMDVLTQEVEFTPSLDNDNVTSQSATITLTATRKPATTVVYLNPTEDMKAQFSGMTYAALQDPTTPVGGSTKADIHNHYASATTGFLMSNSTYMEGGEVVKAVPLDGYIYEVNARDDDAHGTLQVYVERAVAKATLQNSSYVEGKDYHVLAQAGNTQAPSEFGVRFLSWKLNATNKTFRPLKGLNNAYPAWAGQVSWFNTAHHRSYWAEDGNMVPTENHYPTNSSFEGKVLTHEAAYALNYVSLNEVQTQGSANFAGTEAEYCFENTLESSLNTTIGAITHVIIKAQYTDKDGVATSQNVFRLGQNMYTQDQLLDYVIDHIHLAGVGTLDPADFTLTTPENFKDLADVKATITYVGTDAALLAYQTAHEGNLNSYLFGESPLWMYHSGLCYYCIPVKHFPSLTKDDTGYYGMVRNHWYQVNVTGITGFGNPAHPDKEIIPEPITSTEYALEAEINVLSWAKIELNTQVGSDIW